MASRYVRGPDGAVYRWSPALERQTGFTELHATPVVEEIDVDAGPASGGTEVVITGTDFEMTTQVWFGTEPAASFTVDSDTQITAVSPAGTPSEAVHITVLADENTSEETSSDLFTYNDLPTVTSLTEAIGSVLGGEEVVIAGTGFTEATEVRFGTTPATSFVIDSAVQITAVAPAHTAGTVDVYVTTPDGTNANTAGDNYTYRAVPVITSLTPASGSTLGGDSIVIAGTGFTGATAVSFGATEAEVFTVDSAIQITVTSPAHAAGAVDVAVTCPGGTNANVAGNNYAYNAPA